jgi:hypothetical protein
MNFDKNRHSVAEDYRKEIQILLVEDYPTNQQVAMRHLSKAGIRLILLRTAARQSRHISGKTMISSLCITDN